MADQFVTVHNQGSLSYSQECIEDFYRNNAFSLFDLYGHAPAQEALPPGCHEIYEFGKPVLNLYNFMLSLSDLLQRVEKTIFKEINTSIIQFFSGLISFWEGGNEIYNFSSLYHTDAA